LVWGFVEAGRREILVVWDGLGPLVRRAEELREQYQL
jgi:hypothetical protein